MMLPVVIDVGKDLEGSGAKGGRWPPRRRHQKEGAQTDEAVGPERMEHKRAGSTGLVANPIARISRNQGLPTSETPFVTHVSPRIEPLLFPLAPHLLALGVAPCLLTIPATRINHLRSDKGRGWRGPLKRHACGCVPLGPSSPDACSGWNGRRTEPTLPLLRWRVRWARRARRLRQRSNGPPE